MVNEVILNYLKNYLEVYPTEKLKEEILSKGYSEEEFNEALILITKTKEVNENPKEIVPKKPEFKKIPSQQVTKKKKEKKQKVKKEKQINMKKEKIVKEKNTQIPKRAREGTRKAKVWPWILLLIVLGIIGVIILNYYGTNVFGFNIFRIF